MLGDPLKIFPSINLSWWCLNILVPHVDKLISKRVVHDVTNIVQIVERFYIMLSTSYQSSSSSTPKSNNLSSESFLVQFEVTGAPAILLNRKSPTLSLCPKSEMQENLKTDSSYKRIL
ncbi:hypothetical protein SLA2020_263470 [Shorea laevis]